jgi:hypothetical protein
MEKEAPRMAANKKAVGRFVIGDLRVVNQFIAFGSSIPISRMPSGESTGEPKGKAVSHFPNRSIAVSNGGAISCSRFLGLRPGTGGGSGTGAFLRFEA